MISFEPLLKLLDERKMSMRELSRRLGLSDTKINLSLESNKSTTSRIADICQCLHCDISDVIEWTEEKVQSEYDINWEKLREISGGLYSLSVSIGFSKNTLVSKRSRNSKLSKLTVDKICEFLKCDKGDFINA